MKKIVWVLIFFCSFLSANDQIDDNQCDETPIMIHISISNIHEAGSSNSTTVSQRQENKIPQKIKEDLEKQDEQSKNSRWISTAGSAAMVGIIAHVFYKTAVIIDFWR